MKTRLLFLLALSCLLAGLPACGAVGVDPTPAYTPRLVPVECPFTPPPGQVEGTTLDCATLIVPEDRAHPEGRQVRLAVAIFHPAGGATHPDPLLYLSGGPGASALEMIHMNFDMAYAPLLAAGRDLVVFDQRGVGFSEPDLDCLVARELGLELLDAEMDGQRLDEDSMDELILDAYRLCHQDLAARADLARYNSIASAADVEDLRLALGVEQVDLWGASYGTRLALEVLRDHPAGIRAAILDSVYPPDVDLYLEAPANVERSLELLFDACAADPGCSAAYPDLRQVFFDTLERLDRDPASLVVTNPLNGRSYDLLMTGGAFFGLVYQLLYQTDALPYIPLLIWEAARGEFEVAAAIYGSFLQLGMVSSRGMTFSVLCNEENPFSTLEQYEEALGLVPDLAPYLRAGPLGNTGYSICRFWKSGQADSRENEAVTSDIPALVLQGEFDPVTPPAWGEHAAATLARSYYYLFPAVGHGAVVSLCARGMMLAFLEDPDQPPDHACIAGMEGLTFIISVP